MNDNEQKIQSSDHDTLIRVETKMDAVITDIKEMKDGVQSTLAEHEVRIKKIEDIVQKTDPLKTTEDFHGLQQEVHDFKTTANAYRVIAGFIGGAIAYLFTQIPNIIKSLGIKL